MSDVLQHRPRLTEGEVRLIVDALEESVATHALETLDAINGGDTFVRQLKRAAAELDLARRLRAVSEGVKA